jgi:hypothetical protein
MEGSSMRSLRMFRKLVGDKALSNVVLTTSHWSRVSEQEGTRREADLKEIFWKDIVSRGATLARYSGDQQSGLALLDMLINKSRVVLEIQRELVDEVKELIDTAADHAVNEELIKLQKKYEEDLNKVKQEWDDAMRDREEQGRLIARDHQQIQSQLQLIQMNCQRQQNEIQKQQKEHEK